MFVIWSGFIITLLTITAVGIYSGKKVKNASDFSTGGGKAGSAIVTGTVMGTLVGGASTVGTAQLAFTYGFSAWWWTLGGGIGCLILALGFVKPLRKTGCSTIQGMISKEFGSRVCVYSSVLASVGMLINIIAQMIAATALITTITPLGIVPSSIIAGTLMTLYVVFGGVWGTGLVGIVKLVLIYVSIITGGIIAVTLSGGFAALYSNEVLEHSKYFNLFARGLETDIGSGLSLILGVLCTQTYAQAVMSGRSNSAARKGALISAFTIPPIGIGGILIGLFMRTNYPGIDAKQALPMFVMNHMPALLGGIVLATLLITVVGTGAGLSLGISTVINNDIIKKTRQKKSEERLICQNKELMINRLIIIVILAAAVFLSCGSLGTVILDFSFMSMGLRAAVLFAPMCAVLFFPGKVRNSFALAAIIAGPIAVMASKFIIPNFDSLFIGIAVSLTLILIGRLLGKKEPYV